MKHTERLIIVAGTYCASARRSRSRVSTIIFNDGKRLDRIADGADLTTTAWERAMQWLSDNWPEGLEWPAGVERPKVREVQP